MKDPDPRTAPVGSTDEEIARVAQINARRQAAIDSKPDGYPLTAEMSFKVEAGLAWNDDWPTAAKVVSDDDPTLTPEQNITARALRLLEASDAA